MFPMVIGNIHSQQISVMGLIIFPVQVLANESLSNKTLDITTTTDIILNKHKKLEMNEKRIELEIGYLKLLLTIVSAMFASVSGYIGINFADVEKTFLNILLFVDISLAIVLILLMTKIENLLNKL
jgi:hypothetical protein